MKRKTLREVCRAIRRVDAANQAILAGRGEPYDAAMRLRQALVVLERECEPASSMGAAAGSVVSGAARAWSGAYDAQVELEKLAFLLGVRLRKRRA